MIHALLAPLFPQTQLTNTHSPIILVTMTVFTFKNSDHN
jgi:hypothetical protein